MKIEFRVRGIPKAQPRVKAVSRGKFARVYTPWNADSWKSLIMWSAREEISRHGPSWRPLSGPLAFMATFTLPRPKAHYKANGTLKEKVPDYVETKPDIDNLVKALMDALVDVQVMDDDRTVAVLSVSKRYGADPGCTVSIDEIHS